MIKNLFRIPTFLALLILMYQLVFPIGNVMVSASTSILPPSNLAYQTITPDDGKLTWSSVFGATGYKIYQINDGQLVLLGNTTVASYSLNDLPEGSYRYVVSTLSSDGESGPSAPVSVEIVYPNMLAPATLTSSIRNGNDIVLSWSTSQYAQKYNIYQISDAGEKTLLTTTTSTTYTKVNAAEGSYTYAVSAYHPLYGESPDSTPVKVGLIYPVMKQPSNLSFTITNGTDVTLNWQASDYATSYKVYQIVDGQLDLKSTVTGTSVKYINLPAEDYVYKVYSYSDRFGESPDGSQVSLTVGSIVMTPPSNVTYKIQNINDVSLSWGAVPYATGYKVYQVVNGERIFKSTVTGTAVTYTMLPGGNYEYEIYSYSDRFGESESGSKVSFNIETVKMYPPNDLSYKIQNGNDIVLNWSAAENATNYKVYQVIDGKKTLKSTVSTPAVTFTNLSEGEYQYEIHTYSSRFGESSEGTNITISLIHPTMNAPANVTQTIINPTYFTLSWSPVEYATSYKVYQIVNDQKVLKNTVTGTTVSYNYMPPGQYNYEVYSYSNRFGESQSGTPIQVILSGQELPAPNNFSYSITNGNDLTLKWDAVQFANSYKIYQMVGGEAVLIRTVTGTNTTLTNLPEGEFDYIVKAYSTLYGESPNGAEVKGSIVFPIMDKPQNLTSSISNGNDITLKWNTVTYAKEYRVYQVIDGGLVLKKTLTSTSTTFTNMPEGDYQFVVNSYSDRFGESPEGSKADLTLVFPIMQAPGNLTKTITNGNDIVLSWSSAAFAKEYRVYQVINGEMVFKRSVSSTTTTFTNMPEGNYQYI
ncbi:hypothetical protein KHB02_015775, partial [Bacillus sp. FJAT-50051]|nr:hypothetical protein [Neobacillus citreus]